MSTDDSYDNETLVKAVTIRPLVGVQTSSTTCFELSASPSPPVCW